MPLAFSKPRARGERTNALIVSVPVQHVDHELGAEALQQQLLQRLPPGLPPPQLVLPEQRPGSNRCLCCFLVFPDAGHAQQAQHALAGVEWAGSGGRTLSAKFTVAKLVPEQAPPTEPPPPPVALTSEALGVPGLQLLHGFISPAEEAALMQAVALQLWVELAKRRVQHHGYAFDYVSRSFGQQLGPLPPWAAAIAARISALPGVGQALDQCTVNEYPPGVGLAPHIDTHSAFEGSIVSLSLGSDTVMELRQGQDHRPLLLPRRSLLVLGGESRLAWQHYIPHRKADMLPLQPASASGPTTPAPSPAAAPPEALQPGPGAPPGLHLVPRGTRVSLTFRKIKRTPCACAWPEHCDSQASTLPPTRLRMAALGLQAPADPGGSSPGVRCASSVAGAAPGAPQGAGDALGGPDVGCQQAGCAVAGQGAAARAGGVGGGATRGPGGCGSSGEGSRGDAPSSCSSSSSSSRGLEGNGLAGGGRSDARAADNGAAGGSSGGDDDAAHRRMEEQHVHAVYDVIAQHFSSTRFAIWPKVRAFLDRVAPGAVVADVGCGNGKYFGVRADVAVLGSDRSGGLAEVAARRLRPGALQARQVACADVLQADALRLPYRTSSCDAALCIAVLHHISSEGRRLALLAELMRILRPGGRALVTVWAAEQEDPAKTLHKWHSIAPVGQQASGAGAHAQHRPGSPAGLAAASISQPPAPVAAAGPAAPPDAAADGSAAASGGALGGAGDGGAGAGVGGDYFVPWHLPFHRADVRVAAQQAMSAAGAPGAGSSGCGEACSSGGGGPQAAQGQQGPGCSQQQQQPLASIDAAKGAVVFQRYYHLFARGELEGLVGRLPGAAVADAFFDKSNWCVVLQREG